MEKLPSFVKHHFPYIDEIVLAVNKRNIVAQKLHLNTGFMDKDERRMGTIGLQLLLHFDLKYIKKELTYW
jgi:hypothetical protein